MPRFVDWNREIAGGLAVAMILAQACHTEADVAVRLADAVEQIGDTLRLTHPIRSLEPGSAVEPDGPDFGLEIGFVADLAVTGNHVAVLDRMAAGLVLRDRATGARDTILGQEGEGPGEFASPIAVTASDSTATVWDEGGRLVSFDVNGGHVATVSRPVPGDWNEVVRRYPANPWMEPYQHSWEDPTLRLRSGARNATFLWLTADDRARGVAVDPQAPPVGLMRFDRTLTSVDTLFTLRGAPYVDMAASGSGLRALARPIYASEPLFAVGRDWIAWRDAGEVLVKVSRLASPRVVDWVIDFSAEPREVTEVDQMRFMALETDGYFSQGGEAVRNQIANASDAMVKSNYRRMIARYAWSSQTPATIALHGIADCLLVMGFDNTRGNPQSRAQAVLVLDTRLRVAEAAIQIPDGWLLREVDRAGLWLSRYTRNGTVELRHAPAEMVCATRAP